MNLSIVEFPSVPAGNLPADRRILRLLLFGWLFPLLSAWGLLRRRRGRWECDEAALVRLALVPTLLLSVWLPRAYRRCVRERLEALYRRWREPSHSLLSEGLVRLAGGRSADACAAAYLLQPTSATAAERLGLLIFLHGHGGNLRAAVASWADFAETQRLIVLAPSFGFGNWEADSEAATVAAALAYARQQFTIDERRVYLAGYSQGGAGVARAGAIHGDAFAGLIFISPTMERSILSSPAFTSAWQAKPLLVIQGGRDVNVVPWTVDRAVAELRRAGLSVRYHRRRDADHFLYFADWPEVRNLVSDWLTPAAPIGDGVGAAGAVEKSHP